MAQVYIQLGTNLGDRERNLSTANWHLSRLPSRLVRASSIYETEAWGIQDQPTFLNQVILIETDILPFRLLDEVLAIEKRMGRMRREKWKERLIDIDILFYDELVIESERLSIPHPFIQERNFVLVPMVEIAPDHCHPKFKLNMTELLELSKDPLEVHAWVEC